MDHYKLLGLGSKFLGSPLRSVPHYGLLITVYGLLFTGVSGAQTPPLRDSFSQVNSVSRFQDVSPEDWAYQALRDLVSRYNCLAGYPDGMFQGSQSLSRYEFAAGLNACWQQMERLLEATGNEFVVSEDLARLDRLIREFSTELALIRGGVDGLEARVTELELSSFSTTTKLGGEVVLLRGGLLGGDDITDITRSGANVENKAVLQYRTWLELYTSFYGRDRATTRLAASNTVPLLTSGGNTGGNTPANLLFSNDGRSAVDTSTVSENNNSVFLDLFSYQFSLGEDKRVHLFATGGSHFDYANTLNPYLDDQEGGGGAVSRFGQRNPMYGIGGDGAGIGLNWRLSDTLQVDVGYLSNQANDASDGLFQGNYSILGQVVVGEPDSLQLGFSYVQGYSEANGFRYGGSGQATGTFAANLIPFALTSISGVNDSRLDAPVASNSYGLEVFYPFSDALAISGWVGLTRARLLEFGDADIWNYALALTLPDLLQEGNLGAVIMGVEPTLKGIESGDEPFPVLDRDEALHLEALYRYELRDRLSFTPSLIWLPALNQNNNNDDVFLFTIQTQFEF
ncbi:iron uptake porin [Spirulina sp. CS-785/01]|uniref:iron uptake porin n=1 Tax=Spirulina sp. CS-785/01 TaxID=3021716 RepID=UPI0023308B71|nr:iron uptake porin [Spirulina sp. CS-785/01]MDB9313461.1 iron uptake porin [Spirulina sp. CS-785/01]